jgi:DNA polymerase-3 subunit delta
MQRQAVYSEGEAGVVWSFEQAWNRLQPGSLAPVYVLYGPEYALVRAFVKRLAACAGQAFGGVELHQFDFEEDGPDPAVAACSVVGLFASHHLVWLRGCSALSAAAKVRHDTEELERYLESPSSDHILVLSTDADKLDERRRLVKLAKAHEVVPCTTPNDAAALPWLERWAAEQEVRIGRDALHELWRRTGNLSAAFTELAKLVAYCGSREATVEDVRFLTAAPLEDNVFDWVDAVVSGRAAQAIRVLDDVIRSGNDPVGLLALIERQIRLMAHAKLSGARGETPKQIAARMGVHPYAVQVAARQARRLTQAQLEELMLWAADAEYAVKSGRRDPRHALELLVAQAAGVLARTQGKSTG